VVEYEVKGNLTVTDTQFSLDAARRGRRRAYVFEELALPHIRTKRLKRVLASYSPTSPGFYLYYPNRHDQPTKLRALIESPGVERSERRAACEGGGDRLDDQAVFSSESFSSLFICSRITNFCILPVIVIGKASTNLM
jgi:hypothetical protein